MNSFAGPEWVEKYCIEKEVLSSCIDKWTFTYRKEKGYIYICMPYPGVHLWMNEVYMHRIPTEQMERYRFIKMNYCAHGRAEVLLEDGRYVYLQDGLLSIDTNEPREDFLYPRARYDGLEITMDLNILEEHPIQAFLDIGFDPGKAEEELEKIHGSYLAEVSREWQELAENVMEKLKRAEGTVEDYRFYTLQLLHLIRGGAAVPLEKKLYLTKGQKGIAESVEKKITGHLSERFTVEELALEYGVSPSSLKKYFEQVYGIPISEYIRGKRMEHACRLLSGTSMSVADVAAEAGYSNQGKFGSVFKRYTEKTPLEYRRLHRERSEEQ